jgi:xanthine dehydrogenase accessory factor
LNERLFARLAARLRAAPQVLASVLHTRGATPRKAGARMLIGAADSVFSIGGGLAEALVLTAARALLASEQTCASISIDLSGGVDSAGVCGGQMQLALRVWHQAELPRAEQIAAELSAGTAVRLQADDIGAGAGAELIEPDPRLLIVGGGHCGLALYQLARYLDFDIWIVDPHGEPPARELFAEAELRSGDYSALGEAVRSDRALYAVLLNRDFHSDVQTLRAIAGARFAYLGMMGSRKRIATVLAELAPEQARQLSTLQAPVGIEIGAQSPHEIAVSILAELIRVRAAAGK